MIKNCLICQKSFYTKPFFIKKGQGKYCSSKCYWTTLKNVSFFKGKTHSLEARLKMSNDRKGQRRSPATEFKKGQNAGSKNFRWNGGYHTTKGGYLKKKVGDKYIFIHRIIVEQYIKRPLLPSETVHHINENVTDNRLKNFIVFKNHGYHNAFHKWGYYNPKNIIFDGRQLPK